MKERKVAITIVIPLEYPDDWDDADINFHLNDSSWCLGNALDKINEYAEKRGGCICDIAHGEVLPKEDETERGDDR